VCGDEVADEGEDRHNDVFSNRDDVRTSNFCDGDTAVCLVSGIEVNVVRADSGGHGEFKLLGFCETLGGEVAGVEAVDVSGRGGRERRGGTGW